MSAKLVQTFCPAPVTERGRFSVIHVNEKKDKLVYGNNRACYFRSISNPAECDFFNAHAGQKVTAAAYSNGGGYICSGDETGVIKIFSPDHPDKIVKLELHALGGRVNDVAWSPDDQRVVVVGEGKTAYGKVFMADGGSSVGDISGHTAKLNSVSFRQARPFRIATGADDHLSNLYAGPPFKLEKALPGQQNFVNCARFSPDGTYLATGGANRKVFLYDGKSGDELGLLGDGECHTGGIYQLAFSPDSKQLVTVSADKTAKVWDAESRTCVRTMTVGDSKDRMNMLVGVEWVKNTIIVLALSGDLHYFEGDAVTPTRTIYGHQTSLVRALYCKENGILYTGDSVGRVCAWKIGEGCLGRLQGPAKPLETVASGLAMCEGKLLVAGADTRVFAVSPDTLQVEKEVKLDRECRLAVAVPGKDLVVVMKSSGVTGLKADLTKVFEHDFDYSPLCLDVSPDGSTFAVGSPDGIVRLYSTENCAQPRETIQVCQHKVFSVAYSPNGEYLVVTDGGKAVHMFTVADNKDMDMRWQFHHAGVTCAAWAPNSVTLATGGHDGHIIVWSMENPKQRQLIFGAHTGGVASVQFVDDATFVSVGQDGCIRTWKIE